MAEQLTSTMSPTKLRFIIPYPWLLYDLVILVLYLWVLVRVVLTVVCAFVHVILVQTRK